MQVEEADPKGLIRESYKIEGITGEECRSIFADWALSVSSAVDPRAAIRLLRDTFGSAAPDHPMTHVLSEGLADAPPPRRRGGRAGRMAANSRRKG